MRFPFMGRRYPAIDLAGAVVVITGGARGIGRATAAAFVERGATVCLGDLDGDEARRTAGELGPGVRAFQVDVAARDSFAAFIAAVMDDAGRIDVLVNNAGVMPLGDFLAEDDAVSRTTLEVNLLGPINGMRLVLPAMIERGRGHVVNVCSMAGKIPLPGMAVYNASKFGAVGLTAAVRREFAETGVSVSAVLPAAVRTRLSSGVTLGGGLPTVDPEDIAAAIVASCDSRKGEIPVPGFLAGWDLLDAVTPEPVMRFGRRVIGDDRGLTGLDPAGRAGYVDAIDAQVRRRAH